MRLIDADKLKEQINSEKNSDKLMQEWYSNMVNEQPTIDILKNSREMMVSFESYPKYSDKSLMNRTKKQLVEYIRCILNNWENSCEVNSNMYNYVKVLQEKCK